MVLHYIAQSKTYNVPEDQNTIGIINEQRHLEHGVNTISRRKCGYYDQHISVAPTSHLMLEHGFKNSFCNGDSQHKKQRKTYYSETYCYREQSVVKINILVTAEISVSYAAEIFQAIVRDVLLADAEKRVQLDKSERLTPKHESAAVNIGVLVTYHLFCIARLRRNIRLIEIDLVISFKLCCDCHL